MRTVPRSVHTNSRRRRRKQQCRIGGATVPVVDISGPQHGRFTAMRLNLSCPSRRAWQQIHMSLLHGEQVRVDLAFERDRFGSVHFDGRVKVTSPYRDSRNRFRVGVDFQIIGSPVLEWWR